MLRGPWWAGNERKVPRHAKSESKPGGHTLTYIQSESTKLKHQALHVTDVGYLSTTAATEAQRW